MTAKEFHRLKDFIAKAMQNGIPFRYKGAVWACAAYSVKYGGDRGRFGNYWFSIEDKEYWTSVGDYVELDSVIKEDKVCGIPYNQVRRVELSYMKKNSSKQETF